MIVERYKEREVANRIVQSHMNYAGVIGCWEALVDQIAMAMVQTRKKETQRCYRLAVEACQCETETSVGMAVQSKMLTKLHSGEE